MSGFGIAITYAVCWWLVLFMVLPWGVRTEAQPQPGNAVSAPARPRLKRKMLVTSLLTIIPTVAFYLVIAEAKAEPHSYSTRHAGSGCKPATLPNTAGDVPVDIAVPIAPYLDTAHQGSTNNTANAAASSQGSLGVGKAIVGADGRLMVDGKPIGAAQATGECPAEEQAE